MQQAVGFQAPLSVKPAMVSKARSRATATHCSVSKTVQDNSCRPQEQRDELRHDSEGSLAVCVSFACMKHTLIRDGHLTTQYTLSHNDICRFVYILRALSCRPPAVAEGKMLVWEIEEGTTLFWLGWPARCLQESVSA